jgi:hypothetical protein
VFETFKGRESAIRGLGIVVKTERVLVQGPRKAIRGRVNLLV